jgi:predicted dehydrogenase
MATPVRIAMVGLGWWGKKMVTVMQAAPADLTVVCAVEPQADTVREFCAERKIPLYTDLAQALADPKVDAVVLATPHELHEAQIEQAVAAGKHVFCEKPLALTRAGAVKAVEACAARGLVLGMGHERRYEPPVSEMIKAAESGALGRLLQIEANFSHDKFLSLDASNWRLKANHAPAAGMTATGIHLTDLSVRLLGPASDVRVVCENLASEFPQGDTMSAHVRFAGGGTAYISATLVTPFISRFAVYGTKGWIEVRDKAHVESPDGWIVTKASTGSAIESYEVPPAEPVRDNLVAFARAIRGEQAYPITGAQLIDNIALLEAIVVSAGTGLVEKVG